MHFRKLTPIFLLIFSLTFALSASSDLKVEDATNTNEATLACPACVLIYGATIIRRPELTSIYNIVTANIMGSLSREQHISIIESLPDLAVGSCFVVAARALLFSRIDSSRMFTKTILCIQEMPTVIVHKTLISHILETSLATPIQIENLIDPIENFLQLTKDTPPTKFAAGYTPYANVESTQAHLGALLVQWQTNRPETANEMFKQAFSYWRELKFKGAKLDPRDVVFYLIFGEGITQHQPYLGSSFGKARYYDDIFDLNDYVKTYEALEQDGFKKANTSFWNSLGQALGLY